MTRLAIIAGQGNLPLQVAKAAVHQGYDVFIFPIDGQADAVFDGFAVQPVGWVRLVRYRVLRRMAVVMW